MRAEIFLSLSNAMVLLLTLNKSSVVSCCSMGKRILASSTMTGFNFFNPSLLSSSKRMYRLYNHCMMTSTANNIDILSLGDDQLASDTPQRTNNNNNMLLHTVMVHRNRQSAAFREGTPLIFGGSVASTFTECCHDDNDSYYSIDDSGIPMGALVGVVVSRDASSASNSNGRGKNRKDSRGEKSSNSNDKKENNVQVPHYTFGNGVVDEDTTRYRDMINQSQLIGYGVYNPLSMYRVRMLCHDTIHKGLTKELRSIRKQIQRRGSIQSSSKEDYCMTTVQLKLILERKLSDAIYTRMAMGLPSPGITDTYRLVNGEGDGLSGLAVDIIGGTVIVMASAAWCEIHKQTILQVLQTSLTKNHPSYIDKDIDIVWRTTPSRLKQDGYEIQDNSSSESTDDERALESVIATESSVKYITYPSDGQKTGFYCDQRDNRLMVAELCNNKRVLDLCCYNGGFALNAMIRGAVSAKGVDSSQDAVDAATENAKLNGLGNKDISFVKDDISTFMKSAIDSGEDEYDVIVLDPPKLAPSISSLDKASRKYHALNRDAMNLIDKKQGGLLLTCTCSAAMSQKDGGQYFLNMVNGAGLSARRRVTLLKVSGAAPCHAQSPASFPAGHYLTAALFHVGPADDM